MVNLSTLVAAKLGSLGSFQEQPRILAVEHDGARWACHLLSADSLSCSFAQLEMFVPASRLADLRQWGRNVAERVTYLLEPLQLLEVDAEPGTVLLRSRPPVRKEGVATYYELVLQRTGDIRLRRFSRRRDETPATEVPCQMTKEALQKLTADLVASWA